MIVRPKFVQTKKCNGCGAVLDRSMFTLDKRNTDGLHVHQNLTIKLASWNDSKGNKYEL